MGFNSKWDFDAPKYWDFTERNASERPTDAWFSTETISPASFETKILTNSFQPIFANHKIGVDSFIKKKHLAKSIKQKSTTIFERLHKDNTISSALKHSTKTSQKKIYPHGEKTQKTSPPRLHTNPIPPQQALHSPQSTPDLSQPKSDKNQERQKDDGVLLASPTLVHIDNNPVAHNTSKTIETVETVETYSSKDHHEEEEEMQDVLPVVEPDKSEVVNKVNDVNDVVVEMEDEEKDETTLNESEIMTSDHLDTRIEETRDQLSEIGVSSRIEPYFKRKYIYINCDRMNETIKRAKLVLEESRRKSELWRLNKKSADST